MNSTRQLCIVSGGRLISETFIRQHEERLLPAAKLLHGTYPRLSYEATSLRGVYGKRTLVERWQRLLPAVIYDRIQANIEHRLCQRAIDQFLKQHDVGCILAEYGMTGGDLVPHARRAGIPLLVYFHGHDAYHREYLQIYESRLRDMYEYATTIFVVSEHMRSQLLSLGARAETIVLNPYGPREHFFEANRDPCGTLLALGRFVETKAPYLTLLAFAEVLQRKPDVKLQFLGDGPLLPVCRDMAKALGIENSVNFPGSVSPERTAQYFSKATMFLQHSVTTVDGVMEGTPVAILEAAAAGLPVVSTRHAGIPQAVLHGETGFLVEERDVKGMTAHILRLLEDEQLASQLGCRGRDHIRTNFSQRDHIQRIQAKIDECLALGPL